MAYTTINKGSEYFNSVLYTGNGGTSNSITGMGFQPDFLWNKSRNNISYHQLIDIIRGVGYRLFTNNTDAETYYDSNISSFDSDGFTTSTSTAGDWNQNTWTYVTWGWRAGGTAVSNTDGSITSSVSANTTSGFSIVSYTGNNTDNATVGHGLNTIPSMVITKSRSVSSLTGWMTKHKNLTSNYNLILNGTDVSWNPSSNGWVGDLNSSSVFTLKNGSTNGNNANQSGATYIAYCFAEVKGFSKFGKYTGNGSTDGPFVYTGFKPAWVMVKRTDSAYGWCILDSSRNTYNVADDSLFANLSNAEDVTANDETDFLSNGFKQRNTGGSNNVSGGTYIYMAFAESPLVTSTGIPTTAR